MKSGDIVTLKSGGPEMTAEYVYAADDTCKCSWFVNNIKYIDTFAQKAVVVKKQEEPVLPFIDNKTYQDKINEHLDKEIDLKTKIKQMLIILENRTNQFFDALANQDNCSKGDYALIKYLELLMNLIEKANKLINE
jgi:uncharacterized protein YodC (DUF2158 family)